MTTSPLSHLIPPGMVAQQMPRPPTAEQLAEVELVRGLQVRTESVRLAITSLAGAAACADEVVGRAAEIEHYLLTGERSSGS